MVFILMSIAELHNTWATPRIDWPAPITAFHNSPSVGPDVISAAFRTRAEIKKPEVILPTQPDDCRLSFFLLLFHFLMKDLARDEHSTHKTTFHAVINSYWYLRQPVSPWASKIERLLKYQSGN